MKPGFTLIELLLATLIASMILTGLITTLYQINRVQIEVDNTISIYSRAALAQNQLEQDITSIFLPLQPDMTKTSTETPNQQSIIDEKQKIIEKIFYSINKEENLDTFSFITTNRMQVYWGSKQTQARPRIARVVYRLVPDKEVKNSYALLRQEGSDLDFATYKVNGKIRAYEVINGIKKLTIQLITVIKKENNTEQKKEYKTTKEWKNESKEQKEAAPNLVEFHLVLWDNIYEKDVSFAFTIPIIADMHYEKKQTPSQQPNQNALLPRK